MKEMDEYKAARWEDKITRNKRNGRVQSGEVGR